MNMYFRLIYILLFARFRAQLNLFAKCLTPFRVWPTDLDLLAHMNNGKYLSIMDLARLDLLIRSGFGKKMRDQGFYSVVSAETIRFRKSLKPFKKFYIQTQFLGWDEKSFFLEQTFLNGDIIYARALVVARILHKSGTKISAPDAMKAVGENTVSPPLPDYLLNWVAVSDL